LLKRVLKNKYAGDWNVLFGEFQFAFTHFFLGQSLDGLNQWKKLLELVCNSEKQLSEMNQIYDENLSSFLEIIRNQLEVLPNDFFVDELIVGDGGNVVGKCLKDLFEIFSEDEKLEKVENLKLFVTKKFGIALDQFMELDEENLPVIVDEKDINQ